MKKIQQKQKLKFNWKSSTVSYISELDFKVEHVSDVSDGLLLVSTEKHCYIHGHPLVGKKCVVMTRTEVVLAIGQREEGLVQLDTRIKRKESVQNNR